MPIIFGTISAILLSWALLVAATFMVCYLTPGYFQHEYEKHNVLSSLPEMTMSEEDGLMAVTNHMMDYLIHGTEPEELQVEVKMGGETRGFFSEREIAHMWDVRVLFMAAIRYFAYAMVITIMLLGISRMILCSFDRKTFRISTGIGLVIGTTAVILGFVLLGSHIITHFDQDFITFHHMFFNNDLWILDPAQDMLINIVPEGFFFDTALRIVIYYAVLMAMLLAAGIGMILWGRRLPDFEYNGF